ncbi:lipopolysaccharide transport periplasmic protein LptA [Candidatus Blochmanniella camponoti]|uniref:lipopolysaccharide transport periplasmic protein LptA n=1 Tax=Candidatus Blochmanniella camponoti TaxID=108080 RepID=UPI00202504B9|nr:lipopolysaccharide transport periplasmic protein LptA [Candidatus Blochmannia herculeanus]URJ26902.1 lipopolysaccharide transport periplasmic protein LptA [Candidatus Blochmannia herculeanus]
MKSNTCGKYKIMLTYINILLTFTHSHTLAHKKSQILQVYSEYQSINMLTNTIIFTDRVILKYKNIDLYADKILISHTEDTHHLSMIEAHGNPVTLNQIQKMGNMIFAQSSIIHYNTSDDTITLIGNVYIKQAGNSIKSDKIIYSIKNKQIKAISNQGNKVITILSKNPPKK